MEELDLHGIKHENVKQLVIRKVEELCGTDSELEIITGHSPRMKTLVKEVLDEYKLDYREPELWENGGTITTTVW